MRKIFREDEADTLIAENNSESKIKISKTVLVKVVVSSLCP
jgi:hypothetical protein